MQLCKFILICVAFLASSAHGVTVSLSLDKPEVDVGERVTFTCEVQDLAAGQFLRWQRILPGLPPINLATNYFLEPDFKDNGRFATTGPSDQATDTFIFSFTINQAEAGDSGGFLCGVLGGSNMIYEQLNLTVIQDVTEDSFFFTRLEAEEPVAVVDGEEVKFSAGDSLLVVCAVNMVYPTPDVKLTLGGEEIQDEALEENLVDSDYQVVDETLGVIEQWVTVKKTYRTRVTYEMAGKALSCSGMLPGRSGTARGFTIGMDQIPPTISCPPEVIVEEASYDQRLTCNVTARPAVNSFRVKYYLQNKMEDDNKEVLVYGEANEGGDYLLEMNEDGSQVTLIFSQVFRQDFRKYTFIVENAAGQSSADVNFVRAEALAQYSVNVQLSKEKANVGDDVEVTCSVSQEKTDGETESNFPLIVWVKRVGDTEVEIGTNNYVNNDFKKVGRYLGQVDYEYNDDNEMDLSRVSFQLEIKGVKPEDSGEIGCRIPQQKIEVFRPLTVFVPAKSILLNSLDVDGTHAQSYNDGTEVTFDEGHVRKFYCHVNGSFPSPTVSIFIGDKDITDMFEKEDKVLKKGFVKGLEEMSHAVTLKNEAFTIDYSFANKRLECKATLPGSGFPAKTTGINIKLAGYKPKFVCNKTMTVRYLQEDVHIKCYVHADPEIDQFRIYWAPMSQTIGNITLEGNSSDGLYHAHVENGSSATEKIMTLKIDRIFKQHFRTYYFEAGNELGKESHTIELIRDPDFENIDNKDDNDDEFDGTDAGRGIVYQPETPNPVPDDSYDVTGNGASNVPVPMAALFLSLLAWRLGLTC